MGWVCNVGGDEGNDKGGDLHAIHRGTGILLCVMQRRDKEYKIFNWIKKEIDAYK